MPLAVTYSTAEKTFFEGRYDAAERELTRAVALAPVDPYPYTELALVHLRHDGDTAAAATALTDARPLPTPGVVHVPHDSPLEALDAVDGFIQDPGAALVCRYAAPPPGSLIVDLCAAPGGKTALMRRLGEWTEFCGLHFNSPGILCRRPAGCAFQDPGVRPKLR